MTELEMKKLQEVVNKLTTNYNNNATYKLSFEEVHIIDKANKTLKNGKTKY